MEVKDKNSSLAVAEMYGVHRKEFRIEEGHQWCDCSDLNPYYSWEAREVIVVKDWEHYRDAIREDREPENCIHPLHYRKAWPLGGSTNTFCTVCGYFPLPFLDSPAYEHSDR